MSCTVCFKYKTDHDIMYLMSRLGFKESLVVFCLFCMLVSVLRDLTASGRYTWGEPYLGGAWTWGEPVPEG